jgi:hypothetical protein
MFCRLASVMQGGVTLATGARKSDPDGRTQ